MPFVTDTIVKTLVQTLPEKPITPIYANEYTGEWVNWSIGDNLEREFINPKINFYRENSNAIVFGNGNSRSKDLIDRIERTNAKKIINYYNILYVCNLGYVDINPDFLVVTNKLIASKVPKDLHEITYTRPEIMRINSQMNLIPINHNMDAGSTATMLACYHGARKIFLFGFDGCPEDVANHIYENQQFYPSSKEQINDSKWQIDLGKVIAAYPNTMFYRVNASPPNARHLLKFSNYKIIDTKTFVSLADL